MAKTRWFQEHKIEIILGVYAALLSTILAIRELHDYATSKPRLLAECQNPMTLTRSEDVLRIRPLVRVSNTGSRPATIYGVDLELELDLGEIGPFGFKTVDDTNEPLPMRLEEGDLKNFARTVELGPISTGLPTDILATLDSENRRQVELFFRIFEKPGSFRAQCGVVIRSTIGAQRFTQPVEVNYLHTGPATEVVTTR